VHGACNFVSVRHVLFPAIEFLFRLNIETAERRRCPRQLPLQSARSLMTYYLFRYQYLRSLPPIFPVPHNLK